MAGNRPMGTFETCADIRMSQSVDLGHLFGPGSALSKVPSLPRCDRALFAKCAVAPRAGFWVKSPLLEDPGNPYCSS